LSGVARPRTIEFPVSVYADRRIVGRRALFSTLVVLTIATLLALAAYALSAGGFGIADALLLLFFGLTMPWSVIGFWNAAIGFIIMRFAGDPIATVLPSVARLRGDEPITASTAITIFVRNEPPDRVIRNLDAIMREVELAGAAHSFHLYVLSDSGGCNDAEWARRVVGHLEISLPFQIEIATIQCRAKLIRDP
jgi:membrane glycosyltransferase